MLLCIVFLTVLLLWNIMGECAGEQEGDREGIRERKQRLQLRGLGDAWSYLALCPQLTKPFTFLWVLQLQLKFTWDNEKNIWKLDSENRAKQSLCAEDCSSQDQTVANVCADNTVWVQCTFLTVKGSSQWWAKHPHKGNPCKVTWNSFLSKQWDYI